jgi:gamma-glutamyltranspeptidase / glutathione hydrolase
MRSICRAAFLSLVVAVSKTLMRTVSRCQRFAPRSRAPFAVLLLTASFVACASALAAQAHHAMVVSESGQASAVGVKILERGGNAVDAAVATELAMCVTNAGSCGLGGGGFMLIYDAKAGSVQALDYRERAPAAASSTMYVRNGHPDEEAARTGPLAVGVPGEVAGLSAALARFGTMKFSEVAAPAIDLAQSGFPCSEHLAREIAETAAIIGRDPGLKAVFLNADGTPRKAGDIITEKELAATLTQLGDDPVSKFYKGAIASRVAAYMKTHRGLITTDDLSSYQPIWRTPLHRPYRGFEVYTMPPPSSGGVVLEMLGMLEPGNLGGLGADSAPYLARLIEVMREGFTDRQAYADPDFVHVPIESLLSGPHIEAARLRALHRVGTPSPAPAAHDHGTANLCVVDRSGNIVVATTTINTAFGATMMVTGLGITLNDEMDDFAVAPGVKNFYNLVGAAANLIAPRKRPLSSMSPTIVMKKHSPVLALGGSGGPTIITGVLQVMLNVLDFHLDPQQAVDLPRVHEQASAPAVAAESNLPAATRHALEQMGYKLFVVKDLGAVGAIEVEPGDLRGAFDPRKGGGAAGY